MRIRATEAFEAKPVGMKAGYWIRDVDDGAMWVLANVDGRSNSVCLRNRSGRPSGLCVDHEWSIGCCTEYSPDCGATWLPIAGTARGLLPGNVLVKAGTVEPVAWCSKFKDRFFIMRADESSRYCGNSDREAIAALDIISGPEADAILLDIIKGKYAPEAK